MMLYKLKQSQAVVDKLVNNLFNSLNIYNSLKRVFFKKIFDENIRKIKTELKAEDIDPSYKTTLETKLHEMSFGKFFFKIIEINFYFLYVFF